MVFKSFFKEKGLNEEVATGEINGKRAYGKSIEAEPFVEVTRHGKYRDMDERRRYKREWMARKRLKSKQSQSQ